MFCSFWPALLWALGFLTLGYLIRRAMDLKYRKQVGLLEEEIVSLNAKLKACEEKKDPPQIMTPANTPEVHQLRARISELEAQLLTSSNKIAELHAEVDRISKGGEVLGTGDLSGESGERIAELEGLLLASRNKVSNLQAEVDRLAAAAGVPERDDLRRIEGIGPKIQKLLNADGIISFEHLAGAPVDRLQGILDNAGDRYRIHDPSTWPQQAGLAAAGKWEELDALQEELIGGIAPKDDLKRIEGIGPKIEKLLHADGIDSFNKLAGAPVSRLQGILDNAGERYRIHDPSTWPKQAALADAGKWGELDVLQDDLIGGRIPGQESGGMTAGTVISAKDDLKKIEGIGPKIEGLLNDDGIMTWRQLSQTPISRLKEILDAAGSRYRIHDPGTWPKQAGMAADGKWEELEKLQDELKGGRE